MCKENNCNVIPNFNVKFCKTALYCSTHKKEGMVNVKSKLCVECNIQAAFNVEGSKGALYCSTHKKKGMVNIKNKTCFECKKQPTFNVVGKKALYCSTHKKEGMVDVISKTCLECKKQPTFNVQGFKRPLYCSTHKKEGMVDVISKTCLECKKQPTFNVQGFKRPLYCSTHKKEGMVDVISKTCLECKKQPNFNIEGSKTALYCATHKKEGMVDVKNKTCKSDWCSTIVKDKYEGYCLFCYINLFPDKPVSRNYKTKEYAVVEFVKSKFPTLNLIADKIVSGGCSKRRPDLLLDLLYQIVIIEIDENQHEEYDCSCQNKRIMELSQDLGHRPIVFIRFNPDDYEKDGTNISSCWGQDKKGICIVKKTKKNEWIERLNVLETHIKYWINPENITNKTIEIVQLFYDM